MKQTILLYLFILIATIAGAQEKECIVEIDIKNLGSKLIRFSYNELPDGKANFKHKLSKNDKITFKAEVETLAFAQIITFNNKDHFRTKLARFYLTPNDTVFVHGKLEDSTIDYIASGNDYSLQYSELRKKMLPYLEKESKLYREMRGFKKGSQERKQIEKEFNDLRFYVEPPIRTQFAKEHLDYVISPNYLMTSNVPKDTTIKYVNLIGSKAKNSYFGKRMEKLVSGWSATQMGTIAPLFKATTLTGESFSITDLKGKYVILDFWGSWCGWCIKGFPTMKEYYNKYSENIEIIGVACNDTEANWKNAVKKHDLNWIQILNKDLEKDLAELYAVQNYPTKVIIDKEGKVIKSFKGETQEFYDFIDKLMKKNAL